MENKAFIWLDSVLENNIEGVRFSYAETPSKIEEAARFRYDNYSQRGLTFNQYNEVNLGLHLFVPGSKTIIAENGIGIIGTISTVPDSNLGLAMDEYDKGIIDEKRGDYCKLYETMSFAARETSQRERLISLHLMNLVYKYGVNHGIEGFLASVTPAHSKSYRRLWNFQELPEKHLEDGIEFVPILMDVEKFSQIVKKNKLDNLLAIKPFEEPIVNNGHIKPLGSDELKYFLTELTPIWEETPEYKREIFKKMYRDIGVELNLH